MALLIPYRLAGFDVSHQKNSGALVPWAEKNGLDANLQGHFSLTIPMGYVGVRLALSPQGNSRRLPQRESLRGSFYRSEKPWQVFELRNRQVSQGEKSPQGYPRRKNPRGELKMVPVGASSPGGSPHGLMAPTGLKIKWDPSTFCPEKWLRSHSRSQVFLNDFNGLAGAKSHLYHPGGPRLMRMGSKPPSGKWGPSTYILEKWLRIHPPRPVFLNDSGGLAGSLGEREATRRGGRF